MMIDSNQSSWFYHVIYMGNSQVWYSYRRSTGSWGVWYVFTGVLQAPDCSVELACRMLQHLSIWCGWPAVFKFHLPDGKWLVRNMTSGLADDALEVFQSAGSWVYPGYLYFKVLKWYLEYFSFLTKRSIDILSKYLKYVCRYLSYVTCPHNSRISLAHGK
jgi:hypothetical protein